MIGVEGVTFELFLGYVFTPLAYMMGVDASECLTVGKLIGVKIVQNEFVGYFQLGELIAAGGGCHTLRQHTRVMALSALPLMACLPRLARQCTLLPVLSLSARGCTALPPPPTSTHARAAPRALGTRPDHRDVRTLRLWKPGLHGHYGRVSLWHGAPHPHGGDPRRVSRAPRGQYRLLLDRVCRLRNPGGCGQRGSVAVRVPLLQERVPRPLTRPVL